MPSFGTRVPPYKPTKDVEFNWLTFNGGLNTLEQKNEIPNNQVTQAQNIMFVGKGIPTKRWGTQLYHQAGNATGSVRGLKGFYQVSGSATVVELLSVTDDGFLTKQNGASYTRLNGASWASGNQMYMAQLDNKMYFVNGQRELVRYSMPTLVGFATISVPIILSATNISNATGTDIKSYRITAISQVGETVGSTTFNLSNQPLNLGDPAGGTIRLTFTGVSLASGILTGYNIYGRKQGYERYIGSAGFSDTRFDDDGTAIPAEFGFPPTADTTGGPLAKFIARYQDRLIIANLSGDPSKVMISGHAPNQEKFDPSFGGNFVRIEPGSGDDIVQIIGFSDRVVVFKEKSIWQFTIGTTTIGDFSFANTTLKLITNSYGAVAPASVVAVENDVYFLTQRGVFSLGFQPNFVADALRSNEVSTRVRPFFQGLTISQQKGAVATYFDGKYFIAFPGLSQMMVFDRFRLAWSGPMNIDSTIFESFRDSGGTDRLLLAKSGTVNVDEMSEDLTTDKGSAIQTILTTKVEDFGDWALFKNIRNIFTNMQNVVGAVNVSIIIETRAGLTTSAKSFSVSTRSGNSGWGADMWGSIPWGSSNAASGGIDAVVTIKWANLNKTGRTMQLTFTTTGVTDNYQLLGVRGDVKPLGRGNLPTSWRV